MKGRLLKKQHWALKEGSRAGLKKSGHHGPACPDVSTRCMSTAKPLPTKRASTPLQPSDEGRLHRVRKDHGQITALSPGSVTSYLHIQHP